MKRLKRKKKLPAMPKWFFYSVLDSCGGCKNRNSCNSCKVVRAYRKETFNKKIKGYHD